MIFPKEELLSKVRHIFGSETLCNIFLFPEYKRFDRNLLENVMKKSVASATGSKSSRAQESAPKGPLIATR